MSSKVAANEAPVVSAVHIRVLGPVVILATTEDEVMSIHIDPAAAVGVLRELAAHGPEGATKKQICTRLRRKTPYDAVTDVRNLLKGHGLSVSRAVYRLTGLDGREIAVTSDLLEFRNLANNATELEGHLFSENRPDPTALKSLENYLEKTLALWRTDIADERAAILASDPSSRFPSTDLKLDGRVRLALGRVRVELAEQLGSAPLIDNAREAVNDLYPFQQSSADCQSLQSRMRELDSRAQAGNTPLKKVEVFLSVPMASTSDYDPVRELALSLARALCEHCDVEAVFCAAETIAGAGGFEEPSIALQKNMGPFRSARAFAMLLPEPLSSSVLVEAGMALALGLPSVYFVRNKEDLPWMLRDVAGAGDSKLGHARVITYKSEKDLIHKIEVSGADLFPPRIELIKQ